MADWATPADESVLDHRFDLTRLSWWWVAGVATLFLGIALRFIALDWVALSFDESRRALQALSFYDGRPLPGIELAETSPAHLLGQGLSFLLFGATDATARFITALAGVGIVVLCLVLHPFVGRTAAIGMAIAAACSPTLLFASRVAGPEPLVAFFALLVVVALLYAGRAWHEQRSEAAWVAVSGFAIAGALASGPTAVTVLISIGVGLVLAGLAEQGSPGVVRSAAHAFSSSTVNSVVFVASLAASLVFFFSRGLSSFSSLAGIGDTFGDWVRLLTNESSATPTQFFLLMLLLYEVLVLLAAIAGFLTGVIDRPGGLGSVFFLGWFVTALLIVSFSAGRVPEHAIHVAMPIVLMGGGSAARIIGQLGWSGAWWKSTALLVGVIAGLIGSIVAFIVAIDQAAADGTNRRLFEALAVLVIAVAPLAAAAFILARDRIALSGESALRVSVALVLTALFLFLGAFTIRQSVMLNFVRADTSLEPLAQRTSPASVQALVRQVDHLSRDLTLLQPSVEDPTGGHGITIALESDVSWPYRWYFRDYPDAEIVEPGTGTATGADLVISRDSTGMESAGYTPRSSASRNRVPPEYLDPSLGSVLKAIVLPSHWADGMDFLLFRTGITRPDPESVSVGYGQRLSQQLFTSTGPYSLNERVGTGAGRGQFNQPRGVAINTGDGTIYVVDSANGRVQKFDAFGSFVGAWGGPESGVSFEVTAEGLGPTGIDVSFDGLVLVADTWGHRIVVLNSEGQVVREFGEFGDTFDAPNASDLPGQFFGPRDIATTANEIYVVDTGNERVQVFTPDGTFIRSWGGYGSEPSQFIEPVGIAVGPDDRVYVADSGNGRISVFARDGTPLAQWPVEAWQGQAYFEPYLAFDQYGTLYATSSGTGSVEMFDIEGTYLGSVTTAGNETIASPMGIALGIDNTMKVSDRNISAVLAIPIEIPAEVEFDDASPVAGTPEAVASPVAASPVASSGMAAVALESDATPLAGSPVASPLASPVASPVASPEATPTS
ncbi:MAG: hypothetical protein KF883_12950 [Thermomicrobiales bacterium]|nr:hypothetical protein [Thermomicrobiales bacterium]